MIYRFSWRHRDKNWFYPRFLNIIRLIAILRAFFWKSLKSWRFLRYGIAQTGHFALSLQPILFLLLARGSNLLLETNIGSLSFSFTVNSNKIEGKWFGNRLKKHCGKSFVTWALSLFFWSEWCFLKQHSLNFRRSPWQKSLLAAETGRKIWQFHARNQ